MADIPSLDSLTYSNQPENAVGSTYNVQTGTWQSTAILDESTADQTSPNYKLGSALSGKLDWQQEMLNMAGSQDASTNIPQLPVSDIRNEASNTEKARIQAQKNSPEATREDAFSIGTVYLNIPPSQISISEEKHNFRYKTLRGGSDTITTSGRSTVRIDLDILFNGLDDINNKLRPLLAQFKCTPFLPINNEYVKSVIEPESSGLDIDDDSPNNDADQQNKQASIDQMSSLQSNKASSINSLMAQVQSLYTMGALSSTQVGTVNAIISNWYSNGNSSALLADPVAASNIVTSSSTGLISFNIKQYIYSMIETGGNVIDNNQIYSLGQIMNSIGTISSNIDSYSNAQSAAVDNSVGQRYQNRQIVGIFSQMTVSTMPGFPNTLSCRLSMYVFNYDPYSYDFSYVQGYNPNSYTPDITKCDLFIDWYSNRFLSGLGQASALGVYDPDNYLKFTYIESIAYDDLINGAVPNITPKSISTDKDIIVTGISVTMRNIVKFLPVISGSRPTCQYMGAYNTFVQINMNSRSRTKVTKIKKMLDTMARLARKSNRIGRYNVFQVTNQLTSLCGFKYFAVETFSVDTVPGNPGLYAVSMDISEAKLGQDRIQQLDRITTTDSSNVLAAAQYIINSARAYGLDSSPNHSQTAAYANYYTFIWGQTGGGIGYSPYSGTLAKCIRLALSGDIAGYYPDYGNSSICKSQIAKIDGGGSSSVNYNGQAQVNSSRIIAGKGSFGGGYNTGSTTGTSPGPGNENIQNYLNNLYAIFNGGTGTFPNGSPMNWDSEALFAAYALAAGDYTNIAALLNPESVGAPDLQSAVIAQAVATKGSVSNMVDNTCYPDLQLPTYSQIANGTAFKLTYGQLGLLTPDSSAINQPAQTDYVAIEPDAFYSKKYIQKLVENTGTPGINVGLANFYSMSQNSLLSAADPIDPSVWEQQIKKSYAYNDDSYGVPVSVSNDLIAKARGIITTANGISNAMANNLTSSPSSLSNSSNGMIDGKACTVKQVFDANTVLVTSLDGGTQYALRIVDYQPAPGGNQVNNTAIASNILMGSTITPTILNLPVTQQYGYNILNASLTILDDQGSHQNISSIMSGAGISMDSSSNIPSNDATNSANSFVPQQASAAELQSIFGELAFGAYSNNKSAILTPVPSVLNSTSTPLTSSSIVKDGEQETKSVAVQGSPVPPTNAFTNRYIFAGWYANQIKDLTNTNNNYDKYDRFSSTHIQEIAKRIRFQSKDDMLRMVRAFPTFKFYFVEENRMEFVPLPSFLKSELRSLDEIYSYDAIISIDINKNRKEAADTAIVRILNTTGNLDRSRFGLHDPGSNNTQQDYTRSQNPEDQNTINEMQPIDEFILKTGTRIKIKMGYGSDPTFLENVFTGQISEINMGDVITIIAQGYGTELMKPITGWGARKYQDYSIYKVVNDIIQRPEITHFGYAEWNPIVNQTLRILNRRLIPNTGTLNGAVYTYYSTPSSWRSFAGVEWILERLANQATNNIWTPEVSQIAEEFNGGRWEFQMEDRTVWDICQEIARRLPGYITQVLPFDNRATLYFGPSDHYYSYSENVKAIVGETLNSPQDPQGKVDNAVSNGSLVPMSNNDMANSINQVNTLVNEAYQSEKWPTGIGNGQTASWILQQTQIWLASQPNSAINVALIDSFRQMAEANTSGNGTSIVAGNITFTPGGSIQLFNQPQSTMSPYNQLYQDSSGGITDSNTYLSNTGATQTVPANCKLVRSYHYYDSLRNIISNNIIASDENMWNKVDVVSGGKGGWFGATFQPKTPNGYEIFSAQANDMIWKEKIRTKVCNEPNAHGAKVAWGYCMGNLRLGINEMYSGNLIVLGDPTVKPNDVVFINDYYTDMNGPFEVREVNHHFSHDTGFITSIVPDCICYTNNSMSMASDTVAGGWYDDVANGILWGHNVKVPASNRITGGNIASNYTGGTPALNAGNGPLTTSSSKGQVSDSSSLSGFFINRAPFIRCATISNSVSTVVSSLASQVGTIATNTIAPAVWLLGKTGIPAFSNGLASAMQFATGGWSIERRDPVNFIPLIFSNRPYVAGIEGWRRSDWWEAGFQNMQRFVYSYTTAANYLGKLFTGVHSELADGAGGNE